MLGGARDRLEINEAGEPKLMGETKSTHPSNIVNFQTKVMGGS